MNKESMKTIDHGMGNECDKSINPEIPHITNAVNDVNGVTDLIGHYFAVIGSLLKDASVTDICINRFDEIWVDGGAGLEKTDLSFDDEQQLDNAIFVLANSLDQPFDADHPKLDARLPDGSRISATHRAITPTGTSVTIRLHRGLSLSADDLVEYGSLSVEMLDYLKSRVLAADNILISGATGSGKTTLLNILSGFIPGSDRVIRIEDTKELAVDVPCTLGFETPLRRLKEGSEVLSFAEMINHALRYRPDRILVGEIRYEAAASAFLRAMTTGHTGVCSTIHSNSCSNALITLVNLCSGVHGNIPYEILREFAVDALNCLVHVERLPDRRKVITEIVEVRAGELVPVFMYDRGEGVHRRC